MNISSEKKINDTVVKNIPPQQVINSKKTLSNEWVGIDVRETHEFDETHIPGTHLFPLSEIKENQNPLIDFIKEHPTQKKLFICRSGNRSGKTIQLIAEEELSDLYNLEGGMLLWNELSLKSESNVTLTEAEKQRYARQMILPEVGPSGQMKLKNSKVLIVGVGGLGSPAALYLAGAGVGKLTLIDDDKVSLSNLHRQILFNTTDTDQKKSPLAQSRLNQLNTDIQIHAIDEKLNATNALSLIKEHDIIINGSDNFETRYLLNEICFKTQTPLVDAAITRFSGYVTVFHTNENSPCYECLFPKNASSESIPNCNEAGVLGVLPGMMGLMQTTETLKWILSVGETLNGHLLKFDAKTSHWQKIKIEKDPSCRICSKQK
jgi:molybdopterin/thiamine biosynthesis adenylyltransferase/rhodanese-related sulfurtransferase